jgi:trigger factor
MSEKLQNSVLEQVEENLVKITLQFPESDFEAALERAYLKNRARIALPGFRKGRVPRKMIEVQYGKNFFWEEALEDIFPQTYEGLLKEHELDVVSRPNVVQFEEAEGGGMTIGIEVYTKPIIEPPDYIGLEHTKIDTEATQDEIIEVLAENAAKNARIISVTDRAAENGDIVNLNFEGFIDGEPFEGGKADNHELILGSGSFIDTFEAQIEGRNIGDEFNVKVTFPQNYHSADLAGMPAVFKIKLLDIKQREVPELDDEFAQEISEHDTLEEFKAEIKEKLEERKRAMAKSEIENELAIELANRVEVNLPHPMIESDVNRLINDYVEMIQNQGLNFERYMQMTGLSFAAMRAEYEPQAIRNIKARLGLEAIARKEDIQCSEEELDAEYKRLADMYRMEKEKFVETLGDVGRENVLADLKAQKAMDLMAAAAVAVERPDTPIETLENETEGNDE